MNKVICDVCGTSYPETAKQCPICGCASGEGIRVLEFDEEEAAPRTSTKGGHFTKSNVRKRTKAAAAGGAPVQYEEPEMPPEKDGSNKGLLIAVFVLLLAIIAVIIFIVVRFTAPMDKNNNKNNTTGSTTSAVTDAPIPCTGLTVETSLVELAGVGETQKLSVTVEPAGTTDQVVFSSSDETIASVSEDGAVTAVAPGQAVITITCGQFQAKCRVVCSFNDGNPDETIPEITDEPTVPEESTAPTETTPPVTNPPEENTFKLNRSDITMSYKGEKWTLYTGSLSLSQIKWTSDDESIAKITNGTVVAVSPGTTEVHGEYNGVKATCIIRCRWSEETDPGEETTAPTDPSTATDPSKTTEPNEDNITYEIWINGSRSPFGADAQISVGEKFTVTLVGSDGKAVDVSWSSLDTNICIVNGNTVEGKAAGTTYVKCVYDGQEYSCIVRVK